MKNLREYKIELIQPQNGIIIDQLQNEHIQFMKEGGNRNEVDNGLDWLKLHKQGEDRAYPVPVHFVWKTKEEDHAFQWRLEVAEDNKFTSSRIYESKTKEYFLYNFFLGKTYYWRVYGEVNGKSIGCSKIHRFTVSSLVPRWIKAEGLSNVRDIGGWTNDAGKTIRQGFVYRGCEMEFHHMITEEGKAVLLNELGIKTDLDLREEALGKIDASALGNRVNFVLIPAAAYDTFLEDKETCKKIFKLFTDPNNYPFYVHCWGGADRTGTVIFLLCGILGVKKEDLYMDYELTSFSIWGDRSVKSDLFQKFLKRLDLYGNPEDSINLKCEKYLLQTGITEEDIDKIRKWLLE